ncbi:MAG: O-antigen/teichoic acid export membrane protein [Vicingaceae bacterium]|jgi:O-antigen/teichoic acid export membrane protein
MKIQKILQLLDQQTQVLFKNTSWVLGGNIARSGLVFLKGIIIARGLGVELYGIFAIIAAFAGSVQQFFNFTMSSSIIKFGAAYLTNKDNYRLAALIKGGYYLATIVAVVSTLIIICLTFFVYDIFLEKPGLEMFIMAYAIISSTMFIDNISITLLRLYYRFKENAIINIATTTFDVLVIGIVIYFNPNNFTYFFFALIFSRLVASLCLNSVTYLIVKKEIVSYMKAPLSILKQDKKEILNFTVANSGSRAVQTFINNGDVLLLGAMLGPIPVAFYNIAKKLAYMILIFIDPLTNTIFPQLSLLISEKKFSDVRMMIQKITKIILVPSLTFVTVIYFLREYIILFTFGEEYADAAKPFVWLTINAVLGAILFWNIPLLLSLGMAKFRLIINLIGLIIGGAVAYLSIPSFGVIGAAIGLLVANGFVTITFSIVSYSKIKSHNSIQIESSLLQMLKKIKIYLRHNESSFPSYYRKFRADLKRGEKKEHREFLLKYMIMGGVGTEIGVHRGEFSRYLLSNAKPSKFHLIDPWKWFDSEEYSATLYGGNKGGKQANMDLRYSKVQKLLQNEISSGQVQVHRMLSTDAARNIEDNSLDWIYIDGDHSYKGVMDDLEFYYPKIKKGGFIIGDDYDKENWYGDDVIIAVADFVKKYKVEEVEYKNTQFVLKK